MDQKTKKTRNNKVPQGRTRIEDPMLKVRQVKLYLNGYQEEELKRKAKSLKYKNASEYAIDKLKLNHEDPTVNS